MYCSDTVTFALVTRVQFIEIPFINEFLSYYIYLGVNRVYMIVNEPEEIENISSEIADVYRAKVTLISNTEGLPLNKEFSLAFEQISETFVLNVDMDEFLYLNGGTLIDFTSKYLESRGFRYQGFAFRWIMTPCFKHLYRSSIGEILSDKYFFESKTYKSMALTSSIVGLGNHKFQYRPGGRVCKLHPVRDRAFIFHVSSRGIYDVLNKTQHGSKRSEDPKRELSELLFDPGSRRLPDRFLNLVFQSRFQSYSIDIDFDFPDLSYESNTESLQEITLDSLTNTLDRRIERNDLNLVFEKIRDYPIPSKLVDQYAAGLTDFKPVVRILRYGRMAFVIAEVRDVLFTVKRFVRMWFPIVGRIKRRLSKTESCVKATRRSV